MLQIYRWLYIIGSIAVSVFSAGILYQGMIDRNWLWILSPGGVICLLWFSFYRLEKGSIAPSLVSTSLMCCLMLIQLNERRLFVIKNGGWERADGYGSPLAFLIGLVFELFWFLCSFTVAMLGLRLLLRENQMRAQSDVSSNE